MESLLRIFGNKIAQLCEWVEKVSFTQLDSLHSPPPPPCKVRCATVPSQLRKTQSPCRMQAAGAEITYDNDISPHALAGT